MIKKAFEAFKDTDYDFSVNITIDDILDEDINNYIIETLDKYNISNRVIFEIVESESIENFDAIEKFITMMKHYGCRISIDDFGTGYSNFEYLMRLQADYIKIDGSIIKEITKDINDKLIELGVNKSQGYYFDKPQATLEKK